MAGRLSEKNFPRVPEGSYQGRLISSGYLPETAMTMASGAAAMIPAGLAGIGNRWASHLLNPEFSEQQRADLGKKTVEDVMGRLTYEPRSEGGKQAMQDLGRLAEPVMTAMEPVAEAWTDNAVPALQDLLGAESGAALAAMLVGSAEAVAERLGIPVRHARKMKKYLKDHEQDIMTSESAKKMSEFMEEEGFDAKQIADLAAHGWAKRGWYKNSAKAIQDIFGDEDAKRFAYLLAATSPKTSVESNLRNTLNIWKNWTAAGRPTDRGSVMKIMADSVEGGKGMESVLPAWRNNAVRALDKEVPDAADMKSRMLSGPKVNSFALNLLGDLGELTNDTWMARAFGTEQGAFKGTARTAMKDPYSGELTVQSPGYLAANVTMREAADRLSRQIGDTVSPAEVQETVWSTVKSLWEKRKAPGENRTMRQIVADGDLTDELIRDTPDFQTLLHDDPEFHGILADSGYEPQLRASQSGRPERGQAAPVHEQTVPAPTPGRASSERAFGALEERYRDETIPAVLPRLAGDVAGLPGELRANQGRRQGLLSPRRDARDVKGRPLEYAPEEQELLRSLGVDPVKFIELDPTERSAQYFADTINRVKGENPYGAAVHAYDPEEYLDKRLFLSKEGESGFALGGRKQDDIVSAFKGEQAPYENWANAMLPLAVRSGGRRLDAFDTILPSLYSQGGFRETGRLPWVEEFAPEGWDKDVFGAFNKGEPDVMMMAYDPKNAKLIPGKDKMNPYKFNTPFTYSGMSPEAQAKRQGMLFDDYDVASNRQQDTVAEILRDIMLGK